MYNSGRVQLSCSLFDERRDNIRTS